MNEAQATLYAAIIAASSGVLGGLVGWRASRRRELADIHRDMLGSGTVTALGKAMYEVVALSDTLTRKLHGTKGWHNTKAEANRASTDLRALRDQVRYPLLSIEEGIRSLTRVPHWVANIQGSGGNPRPLLDEASKLRQALDNAVLKSMRKGRPPSRLDRWHINRATKSLRAKWDAGGPTDTGETAD